MAQLDGEGTAGGGHVWMGVRYDRGCIWVARSGIGVATMEGAQLDRDGTTDWDGAAGWVCGGGGMAQLGSLGWLEEGRVGSGGHSWIKRAKLEGAQLGGSTDGWRE